MSPLHALATVAGLQIDWEDAAGRPQHVSDDTLVAALAALDLPADSDRAIAESRAHLRAQATRTAFVTAVVGAPVSLAGDDLPTTAELVYEDGSSTRVTLTPQAGGATIGPIDRIGYHRLDLGTHVVGLAIAPPRCVSAADRAVRRLWGPAVQIPALRETPDSAFGDFGALAHAVRAAGSAGADALAISPVHALFPADADRYSPYAPSSRLFTNILLADPGGSTASAGGELIDWQGAIPERIAQLERAFASRAPGVDAQLARYRDARGIDLQHHATFDALHAHFFASGARGWQDWPTAYHDPNGPAVAAFAAEHRERIDFYVFAQWHAERGLDAAQDAARDAGMAIGLIADLAIGMDPGGSQMWSRRDELLTGLTIGAPPDLLGPHGQNWGITAFAPHRLAATGYAGYIATLRAALDHAGGIRIDHALGLDRLWAVPAGASATEGAYLKMPTDDLLRILAIESHRADAIVIGEDLGTVPEGLRPKLEDAAIAGMRVLWFERDEDGGFLPPADYDRAAVAMTGTHDLATVAGWWCGRDLDWNERLDRGGGPDERAQRDADRARLWSALTAAGAADGAQPATDDPTPVVDAATRYIAATPSDLAILPIEDLLGLVEQPNLPGTTTEHPNWRRRLPGAIANLFREPAVAARLAAIESARTP
jgi:4-alpha-glucanotransferase